MARRQWGRRQAGFLLMPLSGGLTALSAPFLVIAGVTWPATGPHTPISLPTSQTMLLAGVCFGGMLIVRTLERRLDQFALTVQPRTRSGRALWTASLLVLALLSFAIFGALAFGAFTFTGMALDPSTVAGR